MLLLKVKDVPGNMETEKPSNYILPIDVVEKLKCCYCQGYLSCGPIKMENNQYICGRCTENSTEQVTLQPLFEKAMVQFIFPCMYDKEGCLQRMLFNRIQEHEATCIFRTIRCPELTCTDTISVSKLQQHFKNNHSDCVIEDNQIKLNLLKSGIENLLMFESDSIVAVKYCFNVATKILQFSIAPLAENGKKIDKYKLKITSGIEADNSISLSSKPCHKHDSSFLITGQYDEYNVDNCASILNSASFLFVKIFLIFSGNDSACERRDDDESESTELLDDEFESRILDVLTQKMCTSCHFHTFLCMCRHGREHRTNQSAIPCQWKGCKESLPKDVMLDHSKNCKFKLHICPFLEECEQGLYIFNSLFLNHLETHAQRFPNPKKIEIPLFNENVHDKRLKVQKYFTVLDHNNIVRITCTIEPDGKWELVCVSLVDISVNGYVTHEHCRFINTLCRSGKTVAVYRSSENFNECFSLFPRLKAILNIS